MTTQRLELEDGTAIVLRPPTEAEMVAFLQKRLNLQLGRKAVDRFDDGTEEMLDAVEEPAREEVETLLDQWPALEQDLVQAWKVAARDDLDVLDAATAPLPTATSKEERAATEQERRAQMAAAQERRAQMAAAWLAQVPEEIRTKHPTLLVLQHDGKLLALRRLGRLEHKLWTQDTPLEARIAGLAKMGKGHVLWGEPDWTAYPALAVKLGNTLLEAAKAKVKHSEGK